MWKEIPPFSFSAGERKIMAHFVVGSLAGDFRPMLNFYSSLRHPTCGFQVHSSLTTTQWSGEARAKIRWPF